MADRAQMHPLEAIVARGQCMGCGFCAATLRGAAESVSVAMARDETDGIYRPVVSGWQPGQAPGAFLCPGAEMDLPALAQEAYGREPPDPMLGEVVATCAAYSNDADERMRAASGGVVPALIRLLFDSGRITRAYVLGTLPGQRDGAGHEIRNAGAFATAHGSHYHPSDFGAGLRGFLEGEGPFAFVGLPCQVAAMRKLILERPALQRDAVVLISLFCGGLNSYRGIGYYLARHGVDPDQVRQIGYRDGAWPGRIKLALANGTARTIARIRGNSRAMVMHYMAAFQGFWMLKRCRICPDQIGDFADIAVGDPHSRRFRDMSAAAGGGGFSTVVTRSAAGQALMEEAAARGYLAQMPMSREEVAESQGYTLVQRRAAEVYAQIDGKLGGTPPKVAVYTALRGKESATARRVAWIDMLKLKLDLRKPVPAIVWVWQVAEYLILRFPLAEFGRRLKNIVSNR